MKTQEEKKAYQKAYREANKAKRQEYDRKRYEEKREEVIERAVQWQKDNKERHNEHVAGWSDRNRDKAAAYSKKHRDKMLSDIDYLIKERCSKSKRRAKEKGWEFDLTEEYLLSIYPADGCCPVFRFEFDLTRQDLQRVPSLDRIDNTKGYVQGNVHFISYRANSIKQDSTRDELRMLLDYLDQI